MSITHLTAFDILRQDIVLSQHNMLLKLVHTSEDTIKSVTVLTGPLRNEVTLKYNNTDYHKYKKLIHNIDPECRVITEYTNPHGNTSDTLDVFNNQHAKLPAYSPIPTCKKGEEEIEVKLTEYHWADLIDPQDSCFKI